MGGRAREKQKRKKATDSFLSGFARIPIIGLTYAIYNFYYLQTRLNWLSYKTGNYCLAD